MQVHYPKGLPYCNVILSWMIEIWIKFHVLSDSNCNIVNLYNVLMLLQGIKNNVMFKYNINDTTRLVYN
jgi:hypothetical protein